MIETVADLIARLPDARIDGTLAVEARRPVPADGALKDALFTHPGGVGKPARVTYRLALPALAADERLVLAFDTGLSDGIPPGERHKSDGVDFAVEVDGARRFARTVTESRWQPGALDLTDHAGRTIALTLVADARKNEAYDWALWARPRVLRLGGVDRGARVGVATLTLRAPARITLRPRGPGAPLVHDADAGDLALSFAFPDAAGVAVEVAPADALIPGRLRVAPLPPRPVVAALGAADPIPRAGQTVRLRVEVRNDGEGWLPPGGLSTTKIVVAHRRPAIPDTSAFRESDAWCAAMARHDTEWAGNQDGGTPVSHHDLRGGIRGNTTLTVDGKALPARALPALAPGERAWLEWAWRTPAKPGTFTLTYGDKTATVRTYGARHVRTVTAGRLRVEIFADGWAQLWRGGEKVGILAPVAPDLRLTPVPGRGALRLTGSRLPTLYAGSSRAHAGALVPGVEHLSPGEPSSNPRGFGPGLGDRHAPPADWLTAPVVAVSFGPGALAPPLNPPAFWCPDSLRTPAAPTRPRWTLALLGKPGARARIAIPDPLRDTHTLAFDGDEVLLVATDGGPLTALRAWLDHAGGLPDPGPIPDALPLCRKGFETLWSPTTRQWKPMVEVGPEPNAGIAALLWLDGLVHGNAGSLARAREAVDALPPAQWAQRGACHLMRFELPLLAGKVPEAYGALKAEIDALRAGQSPDGGWRFGAKAGPGRTLGAAGDSVSGISSHAAWMLLRWARISGDPDARAAGEKALAFTERFDLPRGASVWECPIYEPDVLAAVWLLAAHVEGWAATGNPRWLKTAVRWAESAVPFVYLWGRRDRPAMRGACIATYGTTFYLHSWLGRPVQWEGLILAAHARRLADALTAHPMPPGELPFAPKDWRRLADLLLASGLRQQRPDGTYPDSIVDFKDPQPTYINPENLMALLLERTGWSPEIQTVAWRGLRVSGMARMEPDGGALRLRYFPGHTAHFVVHGPERALSVGGRRVEATPIAGGARTFSVAFERATAVLEYRS